MTRLRIAHGVLFDDEEVHALADNVDLTLDGSTPSRANMRWHDAIIARNELDPATRELVRIRAARYHQCGLCYSVRLVEGGKRVVSADLESRIENYQSSDFSGEQKAALRYADAHMIDPARIDHDLRQQLRTHFTREQLVQLTLEVSSWNYQKVLVALSIDTAVSDKGLTGMTINENGVCTFGGLLR